MIIGRDYLLKKSTGPSAPKLFLDMRVVPAAVNVAGGVEIAIDRVAHRTGVRPALLLLIGLAGATAFAVGLHQQRRRSPSDRLLVSNLR